MLPGAFTIIGFVSLAVLIAFIPFFIPKVIGNIIEITLMIASSIYIFMTYSFTEAMMLISLMAMMYGNLGVIFNKNKRKKREQLKQELLDGDYQIIGQEKDMKRIISDILLTVLVSAGAIVFLIFAQTSIHC